MITMMHFTTAMVRLSEVHNHYCPTDNSALHQCISVSTKWTHSPPSHTVYRRIWHWKGWRLHPITVYRTGFGCAPFWYCFFTNIGLSNVFLPDGSVVRFTCWKRTVLLNVTTFIFFVLLNLVFTDYSAVIFMRTPWDYQCSSKWHTV